MRVGVLGLHHESNTFAPEPTPLSAFDRGLRLVGPAVRDTFRHGHHEVAGFFAQADADGLDAVPLSMAWALPAGRVTADAADALAGQLLDSVRQAGPLDGLLVAIHGAAVAEGCDDFDGSWLERLRALVGPGVPIIGTLDLHANLSPRMAAATDALFPYRTNPHLDQCETGRRAASLMARTLRGEVRPVSAAAFPPMVINIEAQGTDREPCRSLYEFAAALRTRPGVLEVGLLLGFPYADVPELGAAVTVTADGDADLARRTADEFAAFWWGQRRAFRGNLTSITDAVRVAADPGVPGPVCLLDMGDNVGGGGPADSTAVAHELVRQGVAPAFVCLYDPEGVAAAEAAGVGGLLMTAVGGKTDARAGDPLPGPFTVKLLADGVFEETEARHGGLRRFDQGRTAVVEGGGLTVMLTSRRMMPVSLSQMTAFGLDPAAFRAIVAKGVHAPTGAYAPVCPTLVRVNSPGCTSADLADFAYRNRRGPLDPFEAELAWSPEDGR